VPIDSPRPISHENPLSAILQHVTRAAAPASHRMMTEVNVNDLLMQTRARGLHLPIEVWEDLSAVDRYWRAANEDLLVAVYGRCNVLLGDEDVQLLDLISQELRSSGVVWVRELFRDEEEEFF
jgi:hypothetical protein